MLGTKFTRRGFVTGLAAAGAAAAVPTLLGPSALGKDGDVAPSDQIALGLIGCGRRGRDQILKGYLLARKDARVLAVADVYRPRREATAAMVGKGCAAYNDFRELLARQDIDAVIVATPDHWHAIPSIEACRNGKDVLCEKPLTYTIREGRAMVEAARRFGRVVSGGSQRVRDDHGRMADYIASGAIGQIRQVFAPGFGAGAARQQADTFGPVPDGLDWDMWLGPAPWAPFSKQIFDPYGEIGWHQLADFGTGTLGNWGAHRLGGVLYALQLEETGPNEIIPEGKGGVTFRYANGLLLHVGKSAPKEGGTWIGANGVAHGLDKPPSVSAQSPLRQYRTTDGSSGKGSFFGDFAISVRTRQKPFQDVEYAHRTASLCHLVAIALKLQRPLRWDPVKEEFVDDEAANRLLDRPRREPWTL